MTPPSSRYDPDVHFDVETIDTKYRDDLAAKVYRPRGTGPFPALIDVHGGAWNFGTLTGGEHVDRPLAGTGLVVIAIDFRLAPDHPYPAQVSDLNLAIRWVKANAAKFGIDGDAPLGVIGHSSGGQTAILSAMRPSDSRYAAEPVDGGAQVDASVDYVMTLCPVIDPHARYVYAKENGQENLVTATEAYFLSEDAMEEGNPQVALDRGEGIEKPPLLILQGTADVNVPMSISERFTESYQAAGGSVRLERFEGVPHLFAAKPGPDTDRAVALMKAFVSVQMTAVASV